MNFEMNAQKHEHVRALAESMLWQPTLEKRPVSCSCKQTLHQGTRPNMPGEHPTNDVKPQPSENANQAS